MDWVSSDCDLTIELRPSKFPHPREGFTLAKWLGFLGSQMSLFRLRDGKTQANPNDTASGLTRAIGTWSPVICGKYGLVIVTS